MTYIVINTVFGGFGLSKKALIEYKKRAEIIEDDFWEYNIARDDEHLVAIVDEMGKEANGSFADLKIVEVPSDVAWQIEEYDGAEWIAEQHRIWR
jgi:hypothetical protein